MIMVTIIHLLIFGLMTSGCNEFVTYERVMNTSVLPCISIRDECVLLLHFTKNRLALKFN